MDSKQIQLFLAILEHGSISGAARALGVTQPAVSTALARLEAQVGFQLFNREGRASRPTAEAMLFHKEALQALAGLDRLDQAAADIALARRGQLTIATNPGPGITWLPRIIGPFRAARPEVSFRFITRTSREVRELLAADAFDLGLAEPPFDRQDSVVRRFRFRCVVAMHREHPLAAQTIITPSLLDGQERISMLPGHAVSRRLDALLDAADVGCPVVAECDFFATALNLVARGVGFCLVDPLNALDAGPEVVLRPLEPALYYEVALLRPARYGSSVLAQAFSEALTSYVQSYEE